MPLVTYGTLQAMKKEREAFAQRVPVQVPITWVGAASEVCVASMPFTLCCVGCLMCVLYNKHLRSSCRQHDVQRAVEVHMLPFDIMLGSAHKQCLHSLKSLNCITSIITIALHAVVLVMLAMVTACDHEWYPCCTPTEPRQVRLVGDFDQWTRGVDLSASDVESDSVLRTFESKVPLLPVGARLWQQSHSTVQQMRDRVRRLSWEVHSIAF